jgi:DNA-binding response OmpR family regulator
VTLGGSGQTLIGGRSMPSNRATGGMIMLVEDEESVGTLVRTYLDRNGFRVLWVRTGEEALAEFTRHPVRLVVLDIGLPGVDGFEVCRRLRARSAVPFSPRELLARVKAILRRAEPAPRENMLALGDVTIDVEGREVTVDGSQIELTAKEFDLLTYFVESPGIVHSRDRLLDRVWGMSYPGGTRTVDVHVGQLRRKLGRPELIRTVRGAGYKAVGP